MSSSLGASRWPEPALFAPVETAFGNLGIVWWHADRGPTVLYVSLPNEPWPLRNGSPGAGPEIAAESCPEVAWLCVQIRRYLEGEPILARRPSWCHRW